MAWAVVIKSYYGRISLAAPGTDWILGLTASSMRTVGCGDEFDSGTVNAYQLADFADSCQLDRRLVARTLHRLARDVLAQIDGVVTLAQTDAEVRYLERFISLVVVRCKYLLAEAPGIAEIEV